MAITKERLQELIKQGATIYRINPFYEGSVDLLVGEEAEYYNNETLYEHKADAEWELEFGNVEKRIKFVKPKPFKKLGKWPTSTYENHDFYICKGNGERLYVYYKDDLIYNNAFNEQNYTEACRLIKKLFMGEGINEN